MYIPSEPASIPPFVDSAALTSGTPLLPAKLISDRSDVLLKVIARFDQLILSTNQKGNAIIAYNGFVIAAAGGLALNYQGIFQSLANHPRVMTLITWAIFAVAFSSILSVGFVLFMILPYLGSPKADLGKGSIWFFGDVAVHKDGNAYLSHLASLDQNALELDLAAQAHALSKGALKKFQTMRWGVLMLLVIQLPCVAVILILKIAFS